MIGARHVPSILIGNLSYYPCSLLFQQRYVKGAFVPEKKSTSHNPYKADSEIEKQLRERLSFPKGFAGPML